MPWRLEDHTADALLAVEGADWPALLEEAAAALAGFVTGGDIPGTTLRKMRRVAVGADEPSEAWVQWWRELFRLWSVEGLLAVSAGVREDSTPQETRAVLRCVPAEQLSAASLTDVKAVTRHRAEVEAPAAGDASWRGRIVLDV
ncbi:MAG: archease [Planctomycetota bacterium]